MCNSSLLPESADEICGIAYLHDIAAPDNSKLQVPSVRFSQYSNIFVK